NRRLDTGPIQWSDHRVFMSTTVTAARDLLLAEAFGDDGVVAQMRFGGDPGADRISALVESANVLRARLRGKARIDRRLAHATHAIALGAQSLLFETAGRHVRETVLLDLLVAAEGLISGQGDDDPQADSGSTR